MSAPDRSIVPTERLVWTAGVVVGASLPHWLELPFWIPLLLCACVGWRMAAKLAGWPLPNGIMRILLAFLAFSGVLMEYSTINGVNAGSALLVVMVALKFLESHTQRDQIVLMIIAYFLVFAGLLYEGSVLKGVYLLAFVWLTTAGLLQLGRHGTLLPSWPTARYAARLLLQAVPIMLVLFILFPRLPGPLWAMAGNMTNGTTGLSETMSPGDITDLGLSEEVAFRVEFMGRPPAAADLYWRGPVLSEFNGRTWARPPGMRRRVLDTIEHRGAPTEYRVTLEPTGRNWAFALDMPQSWTSERRRNITMGSDYQLRMFAPEAGDARLSYSVTSYTDYSALEPLNEREREVFARLPEGSNPRTRALVASWRDDDLEPREIIARALEVFSSETFYYTLTPPPLGRHSVDEFIFTTREGFCEHYASAFAFMLRAAGLPARVVTGYQGGELNAFGSYYIIRQSDAHAWTEVWIENEGWIRVDPLVAVAPEHIALGSTRSALGGDATRGGDLARREWMRTVALAWDSINLHWNEWVVGYGPEMQRAIMRWLGFERPRWSRLLMLAAVATIVLLVLLTVYLTWSFRKEQHVDRAEQAFAAFVNKLARAKVPPRGPAEGPSAYGRRAETELPGSAREIERIVRSYVAARYEPDPRGRELERLVLLVKDFRASSAPA